MGNARALVFVGHRVFDGASIATVRPLEHIFSCDSGETAKLIADAHGVRVDALEDQVAYRNRWTSADLDTIAKRLEYTLAIYEGEVVVLPYAATTRIEHLSRYAAVRQVLAPSAELRNRLDDKRTAKELFAIARLPAVSTVIGPMSAGSLQDVAAKFGYPFVVRAPMGSTGTSTFRVDNPSECIALEPVLRRHDWAQWIFESYISGYSLNINCVAMSDRVVTYPPSVQLIGLDDCTDYRFGFCGNDYVAAKSLDRNIIAECHHQSTKIGEELIAAGYRGIFGVDYLVHPSGTLYPCEINPRMQNSTAILNFMSAGHPPSSPVRMHIDSFSVLDSNGVATRVAPQIFLNHLIVYADAQVVESPTVVRPAIREGFYDTFEDGSVNFSHPGFNPLQLRSGQVLIVGCVSRDDIRVAAGAPLFKMISARRMVDDRSQGLLPWAKRAISSLKSSRG